ncbi:MAG: pitrilysin family protein, partial [Woeseia sp.]
MTIERIAASAGSVQRLLKVSLLWALLLAAAPATAALDLRNATVAELNNGLVVILLEDRNFPVVSVQMLYRVGARNETAGLTGLAHFLEHMAFRASENFPDTALVSSIYAAGGEWHGYTWLDQTTYYATVPKEQLDLLLSIEADRMQRLELSADDMDAERGAVLAEMHMYENSPTSMLLDAVMFSAFLAHPYRNNTIGWESDIEHLPHAAVVEFYNRHYHPANAVLAVVGDFDSEQVLARIGDLFGAFPKQAATPLPHTREPTQLGERRVELHGDTESRQFMIGYRAPSVHS